MSRSIRYIFRATLMEAFNLFIFYSIKYPIFKETRFNIFLKQIFLRYIFKPNFLQYIFKTYLSIIQKKKNLLGVTKRSRLFFL